MHRTLRITTAAAALAVLATTVTGCAESASSTPQSPSGQAVETPSETPSPTPSPTPKPDLADPGTWLITFDGVGPLTIGGRISQEKTFMTAFTDTSNEFCPVVMFKADDAPSIWITPDTDSGTVSLISLGATLFGTSVSAAEKNTPKTAKGIGIGATPQQLKAAYPQIAETGARGIEGFYGISNDTGRWIVFDIVNDVVDTIGVGTVSMLPSEYCG